ncbi:MAG: hypothetical protein ACXV2E_05345 [Halobacteriota archaeon]
MQEALPSPMTQVNRPTKTASLEKASGQKVTEYAERISANWQKSTDAILKVAADCAAAKNDLTRSEKRDLFERLPFGESMFSKLASIGNDTRLFEHKELMPPSISTMYQIHELSDEQFETAKTEKVLRPDVTRDKVQEWTLGKTDKPARNKLALYCVYPEKLLDAELHVQVRDAVIDMAEGQGLKAAIFTGENLIAQLKAFFAEPAGRHKRCATQAAQD